MNYSPLKKEFYALSEKSYEELYKARYYDPDTIHLKLRIQGHPAFVCQNAEIFYLALRINKIDKKIRSFCDGKKLPGVALEQFTRRCLVDEVVLSNDIEGVNSTRRQINDVLKKLDEKRTSTRFFGLVQKYAMLKSKSGIPLKTCADIRALYDDLLLPEIVRDEPEHKPDGNYFRRGSVSVYSPSGKEIHRGVLPEEQINACMENALELLWDERYELLIRVSIFHYLLGYIHPFYDGNGRLSRFISSYMLSQELDPLIGYRLSYTIKENLKKYYDSFKVCNDNRNRGDLTPFVISFLEIIQESMEQLESALQQRHRELHRYSELLKKDRFGSVQTYRELLFMLLQASLFSNEGISTQELMKYTKSGRTALRERLKILEHEGYAVCERHGKQKLYRLNLQVLDGAG